MACFCSIKPLVRSEMAAYERKDHYYKKAKKEGYVSRSAYKLIEMDRKFKILNTGLTLIDLGSSPGGWLQVCEERLNTLHAKHTNLIGIDLSPLTIPLLSGMAFIQGDFRDPKKQTELMSHLKGKADWVLSDMSPNITGIRFKDFDASLELARGALGFSIKVLKKGGGFVVKIFPGPGTSPLKEEIRSHFTQLKTFIPESTRNTSSEVYLVAQGFKPPPASSP